DLILIFSGEHFAHQDSASSGENHNGYDATNATHLLGLYEKKGEKFLLDLNGWFAGVLVDLRQYSLLLFNDRFGVQRIYYCQDRESFAFSAEAKSLFAARPETRRL